MENLAPLSGSNREPTSLDSEIVEHILEELRLIRLGVWFASIVPFTISFVAVVVYLAGTGSISENTITFLLLIPAIFHYAPQHTPQFISNLFNLLPPRSTPHTEGVRSKNGGGDPSHG